MNLEIGAVRERTLPLGRCNSLAISADGRYLFAGARWEDTQPVPPGEPPKPYVTFNVVLQWDLESENPPRRYRHERLLGVHSVGEEECLVTVGQEGAELRIRTLNTEAPARAVHPPIAYHFVPVPVGKPELSQAFVARHSALKRGIRGRGPNQYVQDLFGWTLYDLASKQLVAMPEGIPRMPRLLSPDGKSCVFITVGTTGREMGWWDLEAGRALATLPFPDDARPPSARFSADGREVELLLLAGGKLHRHRLRRE